MLLCHFCRVTSVAIAEVVCFRSSTLLLQFYEIYYVDYSRQLYVS